MSERDDADDSSGGAPWHAPARRRWVMWIWPATTFVLISVFMLAVMFVRDLGPHPRQVAVAAPEPAQHLNTRAWRTIAADPEAHGGERVVLWGQVISFDPAGDPATFHANVDAARHRPNGGRVDYPTAVVLHGHPSVLRPLVPGYVFTAEVTVEGSAPSRAAPAPMMPRLTVTSLTVTDKTVG